MVKAIDVHIHVPRPGGAMTAREQAMDRYFRTTERPKDADELHPKLFGDDAPIANVYIPMGLTAENVAERWGVERDEMDRYAQRSQERAVAAQASGFFDREVTPVRAAKSESRETTFDRDLVGIEALEPVLDRLTAQLCETLVRQESAGRTIGLAHDSR